MISGVIKKFWKVVVVCKYYCGNVGGLSVDKC